MSPLFFGSMSIVGVNPKKKNWNEQAIWRVTVRQLCQADPTIHFNPHPPCGGWRLSQRRHKNDERNFNPHPPCGGWPLTGRRLDGRHNISIHTLRVEGDTGATVCSKTRTKFQSTPSVWRVTGCSTAIEITNDISIHTLRVEGDTDRQNQLTCRSLFQSTPSVWRVTPPKNLTAMHARLFQSTPSVWRVT